jgi:hypothetical protein
MISVALLPLALGACKTFGAVEPPLARDIGLPPAYLAKVSAPEPQAKQSPVAVAAERGAALDRANAIIGCADAEWRATRMTLLAGERPADAVEPGACPELEAVKAKPIAAPKKRKRLFRAGT